VRFLTSPGFYHATVTGRPLPLLLVTILLAGSACGGSGTPATTGSPAVNATTAPLLPTTVSALPNMDVSGYHELLSQLKGTPVVVNVWASWCVPCLAEAPLLKAAAAKHPDVQFLGVDILDSRDGATGYIQAHSIPYPSVFDPSGAIRTDLGSFGQPVTVFYSADGTMVAKVDGQIGDDTLTSDLAKI
jgi:cytochrome c biogenesis protein CcmG/thiol:disulfide interchange protein DsbE